MGESSNCKSASSVRQDVKSTLDLVFKQAAITKSWKAVRNGLRNQAIRDLHDFLDYHWNIDGIARRVRRLVLEGLYRPGPPELITLEKNQGICRRITIPPPEDALVLQRITDHCEAKLKAKQPSSSAFYSRSHDFPSIEDVGGNFSYPWWHLWPEFQKKIWRFTEAKPFVVVTDVANYFDSIPLDNLRRIISETGDIAPPVVDLLFFILDAFVWRPDYISHSGMGLPQINFDAPRLLAHVYLYPADAYLEAKVKGNFVRWMDDIDFGVESIHQGKTMLRDLEHLLSSTGVHLNTGKTKTLESRDAVEYFWISDNRALGVLDNLVKNGTGTKSSKARVRVKVEKSYKLFKNKVKRNGGFGQWSKVLKRYLTMLGKTESRLAQREVPRFLRDRPDLRASCFRYLGTLGYHHHRFDIVEDYIVNQTVDEVSIFEAAVLLTQWEVPPGSNRLERAAQIGVALGERTGNSFIGFVSGLHLLAKYAKDDKTIESFLLKHQAAWLRSDWTSRQVAAVLCRTSTAFRGVIRSRFVQEGQFEGLRVLEHLRQLGAQERPSSRLKTYLAPSKDYRDRIYPLGKVLLLSELARGEMDNCEFGILCDSVLAICRDPVYGSLIKLARKEKIGTR